MLDLPEIDRLAFAAVAEALKPLTPARVITEPATDSTGADALLVTIVLPDDYEAALRKGGVGAAIVGVHRALEDEGEGRLPIFAFATVTDLVGHGDS